MPIPKASMRYPLKAFALLYAKRLEFFVPEVMRVKRGLVQLRRSRRYDHGSIRTTIRCFRYRDVLCGCLRKKSSISGVQAFGHCA
jgi:hypothetical protein